MIKSAINKYKEKVSMALEIWIAEMNKELKVKGFVAFAKTLALAPYSLVSLERWC